MRVVALPAVNESENASAGVDLGLILATALVAPASETSEKVDESEVASADVPEKKSLSVAEQRIMRLLEVGLNFKTGESVPQKVLSDALGLTRIKNNREDIKAALADSNTIVVWGGEQAAEVQKLKLFDEDYKALEELVNEIGDDQIEKLLETFDFTDVDLDKSSAEYGRLRMSLAVRFLKDAYPGLNAWLRYQLNKCHPLWNPDGSVNLELLGDSNDWEAVKIGGAGWIPFHKSNMSALSTVKRTAYHSKVGALHPVDRRPIRSEFDISHPTRTGMLINLAQNYLQGKLSLNPSDRDERSYPFSTTQPHLGAKAEFSEEQVEWAEQPFDVMSKHAGILFNTVRDLRKPLPRIRTALVASVAPELRSLLRADAYKTAQIHSYKDF